MRSAGSCVQPCVQHPPRLAQPQPRSPCPPALHRCAHLSKMHAAMPLARHRRCAQKWRGSCRQPRCAPLPRTSPRGADRGWRRPQSQAVGPAEHHSTCTQAVHSSTHSHTSQASPHGPTGRRHPCWRQVTRRALGRCPRTAHGWRTQPDPACTRCCQGNLPEDGTHQPHLQLGAVRRAVVAADAGWAGHRRRAPHWPPRQGLPRGSLHHRHAVDPGHSRQGQQQAPILQHSGGALRPSMRCLACRACTAGPAHLRSRPSPPAP